MQKPLTVAITIIFIAGAHPSRAQSGYALKWMGEASCGAWPRNEEHASLRKAALLNWVLGFLSGRAVLMKRDLLGNVDQASVSAWLDNYCLVNPLETLQTAAFELEKELLARIPQR